MRKTIFIIILMSIQYMYAGDRVIDELDIAWTNLKKTISSGEVTSIPDLFFAVVTVEF